MAPNAQMEQMGQAMIRFVSSPLGNNLISKLFFRGVMDEAGEQFVAYFLPTDETLAKRRSDQDEGRDYTDDAEYEYKMAR